MGKIYISGCRGPAPFLCEDGSVYNNDEMKEITTDKSSFPFLRENDMLYVDKTEYIYALVRSLARSFFFMARPRRYGKSLFCSTLHALFDGRRDLFDGLYIAERTGYTFERFPVLHFNFANLSVSSHGNFASSFADAVREQGLSAGVAVSGNDPAGMLQDILHRLETPAVVIIDEYDAPVMKAVSNDLPYLDEMRLIFSDFFSRIKNNSEKIRFFFMTGVTKYSNLSVFSEMNNVTDITMDERYAAAFGYTDEELMEYFGEAIDEYYDAHRGEYDSEDSLHRMIKDYYDGYRFSPYSEVKVYNPVSIGMFLNNGCRFSSYWDQTGVSTLAVATAARNDLTSLLDSPQRISLNSFTSFDISMLQGHDILRSSVLALLYYTGYLTIGSCNGGIVSLSFPNSEVSSSFSGNLIARYIRKSPDEVFVWISDFIAAAESGNSATLKEMLSQYFSAFSYELAGDEPERFYQSIFHAVFVMAGLHAVSEDRGLRGRSDEVLLTGRHIWIFELKVDRSADEAIRQIDERGYADKYSYLMKPGMRLHKVGISFSSERREIAGWRHSESTEGRIDAI